jgi:hypothetical protein
LFLSKVYARRQTTPRMNVRHVGEHVIGFASSLGIRNMKVKVARAVMRLVECSVIEPCAELFTKHGKGDYSLTLTRGSYFAKTPASRRPTAFKDSPLYESLAAIGFDGPAAERLLRQFSANVLREWADITLAAKERFGMKFFSRSPQAYFVNNVQQAAAGSRTPPDWWHDLRKAERLAAEKQALKVAVASDPQDNLEEQSQKTFERIRDELFGHFLAGGVSETDARRRAEQVARQHVSKRPTKPGSGFSRLASLLRSPTP